jgi:hypothetical protein
MEILMGSDNLHSKRKNKTRASLARKIGKRAPYDVVLIVCEGTQTESNYLKALCKELRLSSANVEVIGCGADPLTIVEVALSTFKKKNKDYDRIYCVFDKDQHTTYEASLNRIKTLKNKNIPIYEITSVPCFEYWILLHFIETTRPYKSMGKKSSGDLLLSDVKNHIKDYHKGYNEIFAITKGKINIASQRAKEICLQQEKNCTDNPSTKMHELIEYLQRLAVSGDMKD